MKQFIGLTLGILLSLSPHRSFAVPPMPGGEHDPSLLDSCPSISILVPRIRDICAGRDVSRSDFPILALFYQYPDYPALTELSYYDTLLFGDGMPSLRGYWAETTHGEVEFTTLNLPSSLYWVTLPVTREERNGRFLPEDAHFVLQQLDSLIDYANYDTDFDGEAEGIFFIHAGRGWESSRDTLDIWSKTTNITAITLDGVTIDYTSCSPEHSQPSIRDSVVGVYAHELGHQLFGLPDLYLLGDPDPEGFGVGIYSLMANGSWNGTPGGTRPAHLDAYCKQVIELVTPTTLSVNTAGVEIPMAETEPVSFRLWPDGVLQSEYFLERISITIDC